MAGSFKGGKAVVRAKVVLFDTVLGDETTFDPSVIVFEDNSVTLVDSTCSTVFLFLWIFADKGPGVFSACTP